MVYHLTRIFIFSGHNTLVTGSDPPPPYTYNTTSQSNNNLTSNINYKTMEDGMMTSYGQLWNPATEESSTGRLLNSHLQPDPRYGSYAGSGGAYLPRHQPEGLENNNGKYTNTHNSNCLFSMFS